MPDLPSSDNEAGGGSGSISGGIRDSTSLGNTSFSLEGKLIIVQIQAFLKVSRSRNIKQKIYEKLASLKIKTNSIILNNCID